MPNKELLFSVTRKDFEIQTFRAGGKGGQKQNKTSSGVRLIHKDSGAVGESRSERSQVQNKKIAFQHLAKSPKFQLWIKRKAWEVINQKESVDKIVNEQMKPENLKIEAWKDGQWYEKTETKTSDDPLGA